MPSPTPSGSTRSPTTSTSSCPSPPQRTLDLSPEAAAIGALADGLPLVGHVATRNRGTVGGSIAHADPAAELPLALLALGGSVTVEGPAGRREIPADELFAGFLTTTLHAGELV